MGPVAVPPVALGIDDGALDALRRRPDTGRVEAARQVEVLFLTQLLRAMRKTVPDNDFLPRSPARDVYEGAFDRSVAEAMAARDPLGLVERLGRALKNRADPADTAVGNQEPGRTTSP